MDQIGAVMGLLAAAAVLYCGIFSTGYGLSRFRVNSQDKLL
jgi:hypothetical protein